MMPDTRVETIDPTQADETAEQPPQSPPRPDAEESTALVPVNHRRRWSDTLPRILAAVSYFTWLGYVLAPAPLLLLGINRIRRSRAAVYHIYAATAWSVIIASLRILLLSSSLWLGMCEGPIAETACNVLNLAHIVVLLSFALLLSTVYAIEALLGREASIPRVSGWARERTAELLASPD